jgi:hypothetical protein
MQGHTFLYAHKARNEGAKFFGAENLKFDTIYS